jgi:exopolysaccharide production protein ExoZ
MNLRLWLTQRFELSRGGGAHNVRPMEGLRGFAVFLVFLVHFVTLVQPWIEQQAALLQFAAAVHTIGNTGVDLFFVLSGYLIYGSLIGRAQPFLRFMSRRVERIYPAFTAVFVIYVLLSLLVPAQSKIPASFGAGLLYLLENFLLLPGLAPIEPLITVAWSLSYEMFYYLAIPLIIALLKLRERSVAWRVAFFALLALAIAAYCAVNGGHVRLVMFIAGILLFEAVGRARVPTPGAALGLASLAVGLACTLLPVQGSAGFTLKIGILFVTFFVLCLACFRSPQSWLARSFSWTGLRWLGNMSYSYYLLHGLALNVAFRALSFVLPPGDYGWGLFWLLLPPMFVVTLAPTALLFLVIERPFSLAPRRGAKPAAATVSPETT